MIKPYQEMQVDQNHLIRVKIMQKAKVFDVAFFQNESITQMLLDTESQEILSAPLVEGLKDIFVWLKEVEKKAQMS